MPLKPLRDPFGNVIPHDHSDILPEHGVIRRIKDQYLVDDPKVEGGKRLSSMVFQPSSDKNGGMSVDLENEILKAGIDVGAYVTSPIWVGSVRFIAGDLRKNKFIVGADPFPQNPYHGEVWFKGTNGNKKLLRSLCVWFVEIENVAI